MRTGRPRNGPTAMPKTSRTAKPAECSCDGVMDDFTPQRQTSLIMDPPDGKLPEMTPEGKRLSSLMKSSWPLPGEKLEFDSYKDFDSWDRCITRGLPASMFPFRYNNGLQIIQTPGYVVLRMEMIHEARIVTAQRAAGFAEHQGVAGRFQWTLGRKHSGGGNHELQAWCVGHQHRRHGLAAGESFSDQRSDEDDGALHAPEQRFSDLHDYGGRSGGAHAFLDRALSVEARQQFQDIGICVHRR